MLSGEFTKTNVFLAQLRSLYQLVSNCTAYTMLFSPI